MSDSLLSGLKEPENLTGQVIIEKDEGEFWGNYSCVYLGRYRNELVAAKVIQRTGKSESMKRKVTREMTVWAATDHPNILPFYGFADDAAFAPFGALISPCCSKGDAGRYLSEHGEIMPFNDRLNLWKGVIRGVAYLHEHEPTIIHGDLKPGNILIDDSGTPRICDFGLARIFLEEGHTDMTTTSEHTGTPRYLAPELAATNETVYPTTSSDVYALSCLGLEFIYLQKPHGNRINNLRGQIYVDLRRGLLPAVQRPTRDWPSCRLWPLLSEMWGSDPSRRPPVFIAESMLENITLTLPMNIVQRLVYFLATRSGKYGREVTEVEWAERCTVLRNLCLVSRAYRACTMSLLYEKIRVYVHPGSHSLRRLIATLNASKIPDYACNRAPSDGYGNYVKFLSFVTRIDENGESVLALSQAESRHLFRMMPRLQHVSIGNSVHMPVPFTNLLAGNILDIQHTTGPSILREGRVLEGFSSLQTLYIAATRKTLPSAQEPHSYRPFFPNLCTITVVNEYSVNGHFIPRVLEQLSLWTMPQLRHFHFVCHKLTEDLKTSLFAFTEEHGHLLQALVVRPVYRSDYNHGPFLSDILRLSPNLGHVAIPYRLSNNPERLSHHSKLEKLVLHLGHWGENDLKQLITLGKAFRKSNLESLPILKTMQFVGYRRYEFPLTPDGVARVSVVISKPPGDLVIQSLGSTLKMGGFAQQVDSTFKTWFQKVVREWHSGLVQGRDKDSQSRTAELLMGSEWYSL